MTPDKKLEEMAEAAMTRYFTANISMYDSVLEALRTLHSQTRRETLEEAAYVAESLVYKPAEYTMQQRYRNEQMEFTAGAIRALIPAEKKVCIVTLEQMCPDCGVVHVWKQEPSEKPMPEPRWGIEQKWGDPLGPIPNPAEKVATQNPKCDCGGFLTFHKLECSSIGYYAPSEQRQLFCTECGPYMIYHVHTKGV